MTEQVGCVWVFFLAALMRQHKNQLLHLESKGMVMLKSKTEFIHQVCLLYDYNVCSVLEIITICLKVVPFTAQLGTVKCLLLASWMYLLYSTVGKLSANGYMATK